MFKRLQSYHNNLTLNEEYKAYRNTLNSSLRPVKQNHYHSVLNKHKNNSKKAWEVRNELAFDKKKTSMPPNKLITRLETQSLINNPKPRNSIITLLT